jgi:hypothetical protein
MDKVEAVAIPLHHTGKGCHREDVEMEDGGDGYADGGREEAHGSEGDFEDDGELRDKGEEAGGVDVLLAFGRRGVLVEQ